MNKGNVMPSQSEQSAPAKCPECKTDLNPAGFCDRCGLCPEPHEDRCPRCGEPWVEGTGGCAWCLFDPD